MTRFSSLAAGLGLGLGLATAGMAPAIAASAPTAAAQITDSCGSLAHCFTPQTIAVAAGTRVTWTSASRAPHTVTCDASCPGAGPGSGTVAMGGGYGFTFTTPGSYGYHCDIHPSMTGTVVVSGTP